MASNVVPPDEQPPTKHEALEQLLAKGMTMLHLDARAPGVDVPGVFKKDSNLCLNISYRFGRPMQVTEDRVEAELTFAGTPHLCVIPLDAVFGMKGVDGRMLMWPEDIPPELLAPLDSEPAPLRPAFRTRTQPVPLPSAAKAGAPPAPRRPQLRSIEGTGDTPTPLPVETAATPPAPTSDHAPADTPADAPAPTSLAARRAHLRVVK